VFQAVVDKHNRFVLLFDVIQRGLFLLVAAFSFPDDDMIG
jgi:hypothetical protein